MLAVMVRPVVTAPNSALPLTTSTFNRLSFQELPCHLLSVLAGAPGRSPGRNPGVCGIMVQLDAAQNAIEVAALFYIIVPIVCSSSATPLNVCSTLPS